MSVFSQNSRWSPNSQHDAFRGRAPVKGLVPLREGDEAGELALSKSTHQGKARWGHSEEVAVCKPEAGSSPDTDSAGSLILDFLASRTERINVVYTTLSVLFCYGSQS